jgi:hypothetical protein
MSIQLKQEVITDIIKIKSVLRKRARKEGIWENFGQNEARVLQDKYSKNWFEVSDLIIDFEEWCENFDMSQL